MVGSVEPSCACECVCICERGKERERGRENLNEGSDAVLKENESKTFLCSNCLNLLNST